MKKSHKRLLLFQIIIFLIILLNSFISNALVKYNLVIFLLLILIIFKLVFGFEKDRNRYTVDIMIEIFIVIGTSFIIYYLTGLFIGFIKINNYFTFYGLNTFIIPIFLSIILKEFLRYNMLKKSEGSKLLIILTTILFVNIDLINYLNILTFKSVYSIFIFIALNLLPAISNNVISSYISKKTGYKVNLVWLIVIKMYYYVLPIVPNYNDYILSIVRIIFPFIIGYRVFTFYQNDKIIKKDLSEKNNSYVYMISIILFAGTLVYFSSGYFRFQAFSIGSGSMLPNIRIGDVVIIEKTKDIEIGDIVAYKYNNYVIVHRIVNIEKVEDELYFYSKGDANTDIDNYIIYEDMIIGEVKLKIPFIGIPSIWLSKL